MLFIFSCYLRTPPMWRCSVNNSQMLHVILSISSLSARNNIPELYNYNWGEFDKGTIFKGVADLENAMWISTILPELMIAGKFSHFWVWRNNWSGVVIERCKIKVGEGQGLAGIMKCGRTCPTVMTQRKKAREVDSWTSFPSHLLMPACTLHWPHPNESQTARRGHLNGVHK